VGLTSQTKDAVERDMKRFGIGHEDRTEDEPH
jgi:hypothetical protein